MAAHIYKDIHWLVLLSIALYITGQLVHVQ